MAMQKNTKVQICFGFLLSAGHTSILKSVDFYLKVYNY